MRHFRRCFFILGVVALIDGDETTILTTASDAVTSARPTTLLRIIDVRKEDFNVNNSTDIFQRNKLQLRSGKRTDGSPDGKRSPSPIDTCNTKGVTRKLVRIDKLWSWNHWCLLQPKTGNCGLSLIKYYYNAQLDQCLSHPTTGCEIKGNMNQFDSIDECEDHCKGAAKMPSKFPEDANICELQPISGRCLSYYLMYYYDVNEGVCNSFAYGGCAGNNNKFDTEEECYTKCANATPTPKSNESTGEDASW